MEGPSRRYLTTASRRFSRRATGVCGSGSAPWVAWRRSLMAPPELFTAKDGLGDGDVNAIVQDPSGTIWVASHGGLAGFDGQRWRLIGEDEGLPRGPVLALWRDSRSRLWAGTTTRTLPAFRRKSARFIADRSRERRRRGGRSSRHGLGQRPSRGVSRRRPARASIRTRAPRRAAAGRGVLIDRSGALWVGTRGAGLMRVQGDTRRCQS